ncbi:hypothetical protein V9T40_012207 [Parthenolecanium corni]|uniref:Beta-1,3-glucan-binding protein n=1 Tax=Parthenolecanium corni TaxID=536013 RepID=A0AAN9T8G5_9HEMI
MFVKNECYCSHTYPSRYTRVSDSECKVTCAGSSNSDCGGVLRVNVYSTGLPRRQAIVNKWYLGCYKDDDKNNRMFRGQHNVFEDNSPDICHRHCLKIGYAYFGVTYYRECFCGDEDPWADLLLSDSECSQECNGDSNQKCGGSWRLSVYRTGIFDIPQNETENLGCFKNDGSLLTDRKIELSWSNLPTRCTNICDYLGYAYAGVERAIECRCGNRAPRGLISQPDSQCAHTCPGFSGNKCGGTKHTRIFRTTIPENQAIIINPDPITSRLGNCKASDTTYNGKETCKNLSLLNDDFQLLNTTIWSGTKKMALDPDYEFVTYSTSPDVLYVKKGVLFIKPKIQTSEFIQGSLKIENCTGRLNSEECSKTVQSSNILPPIASAQITTKNSLAFRFGRMEIRAKLPSGDWIVPEIWLTPRDFSYGPEYQSGQIRIAMVRGNSELTCGNEKLGSRYLQAGLYFGPRNGVKKILFTKEMPADWQSKFHDFSIVWTIDNISFFVDGELLSSVFKNPTDTVRTVAQIAPNVEYLWKDGTRLAPFDKEFYLTLGVSVGGINDFQDNCVSNGVKKPWSNTNPKAMINFWQKRSQWGATWKDEDTALQIDHIRLNAI